MGEAGDHADVLATAQVLVNGGVLPGQPDDVANQVGLLCHVVAQDGRVTLVGFEDGREDADRRGLSGAVGSEQSEDRARLDPERDAVEGAHVPAGEHLDEVVRLDGDRRGRISHR
jgi:hypothetical protein